MAGNTADDAVRAFVAPIQRAIGCFIHGKVTANPGLDRVLTLNRGQRVRLPGEARLDLVVTMQFVVVNTDDPTRGPWKCSTTGWAYTLWQQQTRLVGYHWHPVSDSHVTTPHVHIHGQDVHFPTGRVLIEDVLQLAIEYGAVPENPAGWSRILAENREAFGRGATWGTYRSAHRPLAAPAAVNAEPPPSPE